MAQGYWQFEHNLNYSMEKIASRLINFWKKMSGSVESISEKAKSQPMTALSFNWNEWLRKGLAFWFIRLPSFKTILNDSF